MKIGTALCLVSMIICLGLIYKLYLDTEKSRKETDKLLNEVDQFINHLDTYDFKNPKEFKPK